MKGTLIREGLEEKSMVKEEDKMEVRGGEGGEGEESQVS